MTETPEGGVTVEAQEWRKGEWQPTHALNEISLLSPDGRVFSMLYSGEVDELAAHLNAAKVTKAALNKAEQEVRELREELARVKPGDRRKAEEWAALRAEIQAAEAERGRLLVKVRNLELARDELMRELREPSAG